MLSDQGWHRPLGSSVVLAVVSVSFCCPTNHPKIYWLKKAFIVPHSSLGPEWSSSGLSQLDCALCQLMAWLGVDGLSLCNRQDSGLRKSSKYSPLDTECVTLRGKRNFADMIKVTNFELGRLYWIIWVGPVSSHEPFKSRRERQTGQRDAVVEDGDCLALGEQE